MSSDPFETPPDSLWLFPPAPQPADDTAPAPAVDPSAVQVGLPATEPAVQPAELDARDRQGQSPTPPPPAQAEADWKEALRREFETWLETVDRLPEPVEGPAGEQPDLYSFYEQLTVANTESRKANRRSAEAFSQWSEALTGFDRDLRVLREQLSRVAAAEAKEETLPRPYCLALLEVLDRMHRLAQAFRSPPAASWWGGDARWRQAWETQRQALDILVGHFETLLEKEGVVRIDAVGQPFDPSLMAAVATESDPRRPHQSVIEEQAAGYLRHGELLRPAQVKVNLHESSSPRP